MEIVKALVGTLNKDKALYGHSPNIVLREILLTPSKLVWLLPDVSWRGGCRGGRAAAAGWDTAGPRRPRWSRRWCGRPAPSRASCGPPIVWRVTVTRCDEMSRGEITFLTWHEHRRGYNWRQHSGRGAGSNLLGKSFDFFRVSYGVVYQVFSNYWHFRRS